MLNADGGEVWIGLREEGGRAVAVESIVNSKIEERRLLDFLVDTIEPSLSNREIHVESLDKGEGAVLQVTVTPESSRRPYAFLRKGGRHFVVRVGDRIRPMNREELFSQKIDPDPATALAESTVLEERRTLLERGEALFWLRFQPGKPVSLDIQDGRLREFLQNPHATGNRFDGWNFSKFEHGPRIQQDRLVTDPEDYQTVEIRRDGGLIFAAPLESLFWKGDEHEIWPPILMEYIVSAIRMAHAVYNEVLQPVDPVVTDLVLTGVRGWKLRAGTPGPWFLTNRSRMFTHASDFVLTRPLVFRFGEIAEGPDRCGYRLVERVYEAFGIRREDIPRFFDSQSGRLIFPE